MTLTRQLLKELDIPDEAAARVLSAYEADMAARQRETETLRAAFDEYRAQVDAQRLAAERQGALREALVAAGAEPKAAELLTLAVSLDDEAWDGVKLRDPAISLAPTREKYAWLFAEPAVEPTPAVAPPFDARGPLTRDDIARMSEQDINRQWRTVAHALGRHE